MKILIILSGHLYKLLYYQEIIRNPHTKILKIRIKVLEISFSTLQTLEIKSKHEE